MLTEVFREKRPVSEHVQELVLVGNLGRESLVALVREFVRLFRAVVGGVNLQEAADHVQVRRFAESAFSLEYHLLRTRAMEEVPDEPCFVHEKYCLLELCETQLA